MYDCSMFYHNNMDWYKQLIMVSICLYNWRAQWKKGISYYSYILRKWGLKFIYKQMIFSQLLGIFKISFLHILRFTQINCKEGKVGMIRWYICQWKLQYTVNYLVSVLMGNLVIF